MTGVSLQEGTITLIWEYYIAYGAVRKSEEYKDMNASKQAFIREIRSLQDQIGDNDIEKLEEELEKTGKYALEYFRKINPMLWKVGISDDFIKAAREYEAAREIFENRVKKEFNYNFTKSECERQVVHYTSKVILDWIKANYSPLSPMHDFYFRKLNKREE